MGFHRAELFCRHACKLPEMVEIKHFFTLKCIQVRAVLVDEGQCIPVFSVMACAYGDATPGLQGPHHELKNWRRAYSQVNDIAARGDQG